MNNITKVILSLLIASTLVTSGCGRKSLTGLTEVTPPSGGLTETNPTTPSDGGFLSDPGNQVMPGDGNNDGYTDLPQQPVDTPEPLPAPSNPVQPGQKIILKAIPTTLNFSFSRVKATFVYTHLTWQPVIGAAEYWIYKDSIPQLIEASKRNTYAVVKAGSTLSGFYDGILPPTLTTSLGQSLKNIVKAIFNPPGVPHNYKVIAVDSTGNPIGESSVVTATPLPPIPLPGLKPVQDVNSLSPLFTWDDSGKNGNTSPSTTSTGGIEPDGYFVYVYPAITSYMTTPTGAVAPTAFALWGTYRSAKNKVARYGDSSDNLVAYPGTLPYNITFALKPNTKYSWTVISVKTDTGNMKTATAISKAWNGYADFTIGNVSNTLTASSMNRDNWLRRPTYRN